MKNGWCVSEWWVQQFQDQMSGVYERKHISNTVNVCEARQALTHFVGPKYHNTWHKNVHTCLFGAGRVLHFLRKSWSFGKVTQPGTQVPWNFGSSIASCLTLATSSFLCFPLSFLHFGIELNSIAQRTTTKRRGTPGRSFFTPNSMKFVKNVMWGGEHLTTTSKWVLGICHESIITVDALVH